MSIDHRALWAASFIAACTLGSAGADEWPGWMGANRDGVYRESGVIDAIPGDGLKVRWRQPIAGGYAGPAVAGGRVFVFDYAKESGESVNEPGVRATLTGRERLTAFDEQTGEQLWQHSYDCPYSISYPAGPRCTPTVVGDMVYILGSEGDLKCLNAATGEVVWEHSLKNDFNADVPMWGFSAHPLVDGDLLYTMVGGDGQCLVAFDRHTGEVKWKALDGPAGYCPPSIIEAAGTRQLIVFNPAGVTSFNPVDGKEYWTIPVTPLFEMSIARPMREGNRLYASGIQSASVMMELSDDEPAAKELWRGKPKVALFSANTTPLIVDGVIYGTDCNEGSLLAVDAENGSRLWETFEPTKPDEKRFIKHGSAFITRIGDTDRYFLMTETGDLMVARLTREGFESFGRFHVLEPTEEAFGRSVVWSHPAYANRTVFARNDKEIVAVDIAEAK